MSSIPTHSPHLDESISAAPDFSPGIVKDDERLLRALFNPEHVQDGQVLDRAIPVQDLRRRGFSVHRMAHVSPEFVQRSIDELLARPRRAGPWADEGVAVLLTSGIRTLQLEGARAFVVIDTAHAGNPGHASIYVAKPEKGESYTRELRGLLLPFLQERKSVAEAYAINGKA